MSEKDLSLELDKIEERKRQEITKKQSYKDLKKNMREIEKERKELINSVLNENKSE